MARGVVRRGRRENDPVELRETRAPRCRIYDSFAGIDCAAYARHFDPEGAQPLADFTPDRAIADHERLAAKQFAGAGRLAQPFAPVVRADDFVQPLGERQHTHRREIRDDVGHQATAVGKDLAALDEAIDREGVDANANGVDPARVRGGGRRRREDAVRPLVEPADFGLRSQGKRFVQRGEGPQHDLAWEMRFDQRAQALRRDENALFAQRSDSL
jgi:hypothetical protein